VQRKFRPTIWAKWSKKGVVSITDTLCIGKVQFSATERGKDNVRCYLDMHKAIVLANAILNGKFAQLWPSMYKGDSYTTVAKWTVYGGAAKSKTYNGSPESRILEIEQILDKDNDGGDRVRFVITIRVGEGILDTEKGTIKPKDYRNMIFQRQYLSIEETYEMASILKMHIESYYNKYMADFYDEDGNFRTSGAIDDVFTSTVRSADQQGFSEPKANADEIPSL
jgi:hypothetical protein